MSKKNVFIKIPSLIIAYILLSISFSNEKHIWFLLTISYLILILISLAKIKELKNNTVINIKNIFKQLAIGIIFGIILYLICMFGQKLICILDIPLLNSLENLYEIVKPQYKWHYIVLFLIIIPGEELYWRGYIQKKLYKDMSFQKSIIYSTSLYSFAHIFSGSILLILTALFAGILWGYLYYKTNNILIPIVSHYVFNTFLLIIFPLM